MSRLKSLVLEPKLGSLKITDQDLQRIQDKDANPKKPRLSQVRLAMLRLGVNAKATPARIKETEARLEEARAKASRLPPDTLGFGPLAIDYSDDDPTRYRGGDLGWLETDPARYHLDQAMLAAGFALADPGEISPIIRGADALYLVRSIDQRNAAAAVNKPDDEL